MKNRKDFRNSIGWHIRFLLHYLLTSLFEILDQAIVGHYSVRGFAVVGIAVSVVYGVTGALGMLFFGVSHYCGREDRKAG